MRDKLRALAKLAEIDAKARELDLELTAIPKRLGDLRSDVQRLESLLGRERTQLSEAERARQSQTESIASRNDALARSRAKAAKVRNLREAEASEREVEATRRAIRDAEEEVARFDETLARLRSTLATHEADFEKLRASLSDEEQQGAARIAELNTEREKVVEGRDVHAAIIPSDVSRRYDQLQKKKPPAIAWVEAGTCTACRLALPPQQFIELQRGESMLACQHCNRLLLWRPLIED